MLVQIVCWDPCNLDQHHQGISTVLFIQVSSFHKVDFRRKDSTLVNCCSESTSMIIYWYINVCPTSILDAHCIHINTVSVSKGLFRGACSLFESAHDIIFLSFIQHLVYLWKTSSWNGCWVLYTKGFLGVAPKLAKSPFTTVHQSKQIGVLLLIFPDQCETHWAIITYMNASRTLQQFSDLLALVELDNSVEFLPHLLPCQHTITAVWPPV